MNGWRWILLGGIFEVGFTTAMKLEQHDPRWSAVFIVCAVLSFECLSRGLKSVPLSMAYAVWAGIGAVGTFVVGLAAFGDPRSPVRIAVVMMLVATLVALKLVSGHGADATDPGPPPRPTGR